MINDDDITAAKEDKFLVKKKTFTLTRFLILKLYHSTCQTL